MLKKITSSPYLNLLSGIALFIAALIETIEMIEESSLGVHHGVLIYSVIHIVKTIPEIMHGFDDIEKCNESFSGKK